MPPASSDVPQTYCSANLNSSYFTNRQDRYIHITRSPRLATYLVQLLRIFAGYSSTLRAEPNSSIGYTLDWPRRDSSQSSFAALAGKEVNIFQREMMEAAPLDATGQACIFPMVQSGVLGIREEERCLHSLFDILDSKGHPENPLVDLTSGYFALHGPYQDRVLASNADFRIVAAGPSVNHYRVCELKSASLIVV